MKKKAAKIPASLSALAVDIEAFYLHRTSGSLPIGSGTGLFKKLASYFAASGLTAAAPGRGRGPLGYALEFYPTVVALLASGHLFLGPTGRPRQPWLKITEYPHGNPYTG
ncbi:hypothetical protein B0T24DRAFT_420156 [Lasiosphaeria ovina]|uniref:Uncharacterized protein n=1 Tax=Lasiosphaeria ovina TaxID=92902 RepID=A0AAE0JV53_9PEZI|nr:hypothetical protein B0T24DRAFT_420156 [Lasiosphaeria ovina]